ncbi:hypothetical protein BH10PAT4_BH10PAT4_1340 [soil metagenome]
MTFIIMILAIIIGSAVSLVGGILLFRFKTYRTKAILLTMPFGAGALLAAAFFDLLPETFNLIDWHTGLLFCLIGFIIFFLLERFAGWFHHHHEHQPGRQNAQQRVLIVIGDLLHNMIDGVAIAAAFIVSVPTGIITALAVSTHEIPKELGTFAMLMDRGWKNKTVLLANLATAVGTLVTAVIVYSIGRDIGEFIGPVLAITAGFFIYVAASDIVPDIHEQPRNIGMAQAGMLVLGVVVVGTVISLLGV